MADAGGLIGNDIPPAAEETEDGDDGDHDDYFDIFDAVVDDTLAVYRSGDEDDDDDDYDEEDDEDDDEDLEGDKDNVENHEWWRQECWAGQKLKSGKWSTASKHHCQGSEIGVKCCHEKKAFAYVKRKFYCQDTQQWKIVKLCRICEWKEYGTVVECNLNPDIVTSQTRMHFDKHGIKVDVTGGASNFLAEHWNNDYWSAFYPAGLLESTEEQQQQWDEAVKDKLFLRSLGGRCQVDLILRRHKEFYQSSHL